MITKRFLVVAVLSGLIAAGATVAIMHRVARVTHPHPAAERTASDPSRPPDPP
jgi:hypothetical protein